jgi:NADH dehydrogenase
MRLVVTGANGAVGRAILSRARAERPRPLDVIAAVRSERAAAALRPPAGPAVSVARVCYDDATSLAAAFDGAAAVIHLAGVLVERPDASYEAANVETTRRVADAAKRCGVAKLVFVSAVGADPRSTNRYWRTKGEAEELVTASAVPHTVLRVPMLLGRGTEAAAALCRRVRRRVVPLLSGGRTLQQPLDVEDLARAAIFAAHPGVADSRILELAGPVVVPDRAIVERAAALMGRRIGILPVPTRAVRLALAVVRHAGRGLSPDVIEVLTTDTRVDPFPAARELGITLTQLDDAIRHSLAP